MGSKYMYSNEGNARIEDITEKNVKIKINFILMCMIHICDELYYFSIGSTTTMAQRDDYDNLTM